MLRKALFIISASISAVLALVSYHGTYYFCGNAYGVCTESLHTLSLYFFIFIPIFLGTILTHWLPINVFRTWFYFICVYILVSFLTIWSTSEYSANFISINQGTISLILLALFVLTSIFIFALKSIQLRGRDKTGR